MIVLIEDTLIEHIPCLGGADQWPEPEWNAAVLDEAQEDDEGS